MIGRQWPFLMANRPWAFSFIYQYLLITNCVSGPLAFNLERAPNSVKMGKVERHLRNK